MTKRFRSILLVALAFVLAIVISAIAWFAIRVASGIRVGTAVVSQTLCSAVFVSGLDPDQMYAEAIKPNPGQTRLAKRLRYQVDREKREVRATWAGTFESRS